MTQTEKLIRIKLQKKDSIVSLLLKTKLIFGEKITSQNITQHHFNIEAPVFQQTSCSFTSTNLIQINLLIFFLHKKIFFFYLSSFKQDNSIIIMWFSNWPCYVGDNNTKLIVVIKLLAVPVFYVLSVLLSPAECPCLLQTF